MMKILVIGATGKIGSEVVRQALKADMEVTGLVRDIDRANSEDMRVVIGNVLSLPKVVKAAAGKAVIFSAFGTQSLLGDPLLYSVGTQNIVSAMKECNVPRLYFMSRIDVFQKDYLAMTPEVNSVESDQLIAFKGYTSAPQWTSVAIKGLAKRRTWTR
jgi:putative NADH-flavin reductase